MIAITGASGQLGGLVIEKLLSRVPANNIIAAVRTPSKATELGEKGVTVREADYNRPDTLQSAFAGAEKLLLVSSNELGNRVPQHKAAIDAAKAVGVRLLAYTSILHADSSTLALAAEHLATEEYLRASGIPFVFLRNGWYTENLTAGIAPALQQGSFIGASKSGRFAAAPRAEYAEAAAIALTDEDQKNHVYELAGDASFTRAQLAEEVSRQTGREIGYHDLPEAEFEKILSSFLPPELARVLADSDAKAADGELDDNSHTLSRLIGRSTTSLANVVAQALRTA